MIDSSWIHHRGDAIIIRGPVPYEPILYRLNPVTTKGVTVYSEALFRVQRGPGYVSLRAMQPNGATGPETTIKAEDFDRWYQPTDLTLADRQPKEEPQPLTR